MSGLDISVIEALPASVLATIPAATPPPGVIPNFANPTISFRPSILACQVVLLVFVLATYAIRFYTKAILLKSWRWDDTTITLGLLFTLLFLSAVITATFYGPFGVHQWEVHLDTLLSPAYLVASSLITDAFSLALGPIKMTFVLQFYYLFKPLRWMRIACWIGGIGIVFFYVGISLAQIILTSRWPGESLLASVVSTHYTDTLQLSIPTGIISFITDVFLLILPIPAVLGLQMATRKKVGIVGVFALGVLAVVGSAMGLYYRVLLFQHPTAHEDDAGWYSGYVVLWAQVELLSGIIAANMPIVHQFFVRKNIIPNLLSGRLSTTIRSFISRAHPGKGTDRDDTFALTDSLSSRKKGRGTMEMESDIDESKEPKHEQASSITISQAYTVTSHSLCAE